MNLRKKVVSGFYQLLFDGKSTYNVGAQQRCALTTDIIFQKIHI
jgi:hypothetical protein